MKRLMSVILLVGATALLTGCDNGNNDDPVVITQSDNGGVVSVANGADVEVVLPGNPTTGYQWEVVENNETLLTFVSSSYTPDSDAAGSGGMYRFLFKAAAVGQARLRLVYKRSWETVVVESLTVTVKIS